jgi:hypothetical protein
MSRSFQIDRRTFLRGVGVGVALPWLEAMAPRARAAEDEPTRLVFVFAPNGKHMPDWTPSAEGPLTAELPYLLAPLAAHREQLLVLSGLGHDTARAHGDGPGDHARASATFLTAVHPKKTAGADIRVGVSVDQVAAEKLGRATRFRSLALGIEGGRRAGRCDSGYSCAYVSNLSWRSPSTPNAKEVVPRRVFERLFGGERHLTPAQRKRRRDVRTSVLDLVRGDAKRLHGRLGGADRLRLDEYLTAVREVERRVAEAEQAPAPERPDLPNGVPRDRRKHMRLMADLMALALQADLTRVVTYMVGNAGSNHAYRDLGARDGHHRISHHRGDVEKQKLIRAINRFHTEELAYLLDRFSKTQAGEGSLLDRSLVLYGSGIRDGNRHDHHDLPILLAGGGGGVVGGRHLRSEKRTPLANLFVSMLGLAGVSVSRFGDSTGRVDLSAPAASPAQPPAPSPKREPRTRIF